MISDGGDEESTHTFAAEDVASVGRKEGNAVCLHDTGVSGSHLRVTYSKGDKAWQLVDLGSTNGTMLNRVQIMTQDGSPSEAHTLCTGDRIQLGEHSVLLANCQPSGASPTDAKTLGDLTAYELMRRLEVHPLPTSISRSVAERNLPALRVRSCSIQKQASPSRNKPVCEDAFSHFAPMRGVNAAALCICDGHCGAATATDVQRLLPQILERSMQSAQCSDSTDSASSSLQTTLHESFMEVDAAVQGDDGCTMTLLLLRGDSEGAVHIQAANVGDSAVVCADFSRMVKYHLTDNHRVTQPAELQRLRETGAILTHNDTRLMGLNLSRSIGDRSLKDMNSGFLAEPYVSKVHTVAPGDELLLVLASDGLWDVTNANLVMRIAFRVLTEHPGNVKLLCEVLMEHAVSRRSRDDITIAVLLVNARSNGEAANGKS